MVNNTNTYTFIAAFSVLIAAIKASSSSLNTDSTNTFSADVSTFTVPIYGDNTYAYSIRMSDMNGGDVELLLDYLQPNIWAINANAIIACSQLSDIFSSNTEFSTKLPSYVTYDSQTYNPAMCYSNGALTPSMTITEVIGNVTSTVVETSIVSTNAPFNITEPHHSYYAAGYFLQSNFSVETFDRGMNSSQLQLPSLSYLLVNATDAPSGRFGLGGPVWSGGFFDTLKLRGITRGNGHSIYFKANTSDSEIGGYLLPGFVDQRLYSGDFYAFPQIPHVGWGDSNAVLPILQLDSISIENHVTSQSVSIYNDKPFAILLDASLQYSYLPRDVLIQLALQTDASFNADFDTWIVNCSTTSVNATLNFKFGPLLIDIPIDNIVWPSSWNNSDGSPACILNILSSEYLGYNVLGSSFSPEIYMAIDNEGGKIAVAQANKNFNESSTGSVSNSIQSPEKIGYIRADYIPFATNISLSDTPTFTFGSVNVSAQHSEPPFVSNAYISSGIVYISGAPVVSNSNLDSSTKSKSSTGGVSSFKFESSKIANPILYAILLVGAVIGLMTI